MLEQPFLHKKYGKSKLAFQLMCFSLYLDPILI